MIKTILKTPKMMLRRRKNEKIIRLYDHRSDESMSCDRSSLKDGFGRFKIDEILESPGLTERMRDSNIRMLPTGGSRVYFSWDIPNFIWEAVLNSATLYKIVSEYIGPDVRLDDFYVKNVADGYNATAEGWHNDNVGYRLKLFMVFDTEGLPSATVVRPQQRPNLYNVNYKEEFFRTLKSKDMLSYPDEITVDYNPGDCLFFDTNLQHRGSYHAGNGTRYCVIAEFIDRNKSNALRGKAPCGPKQGKGKVSIPLSARELVNKSKLNDKAILSANNKYLTYG